jgi:hypothetical protein
MMPLNAQIVHSDDPAFKKSTFFLLQARFGLNFIAVNNLGLSP